MKLLDSAPTLLTREVVMAMLRGWMLLIVLLFTISGCALVEVHVKPPEAGLEQPIPGGNQRQVIVTIPFQDARQSASRCGVQKNGWGAEMAQAVCQGNPTQLIAELLSARAIAYRSSTSRGGVASANAAHPVVGSSAVWSGATPWRAVVLAGWEALNKENAA